MNLEIEQLDVKITFLLGDLEAEIYIEHPDGFKVNDKKITSTGLGKTYIGEVSA